jgi:lipopolysaccharide transport system permease protein
MKCWLEMKLRFQQSIWQSRELLWRLTEREVQGRYRGSLFGVGWTVLQPLLMLAVYTFVFSQVFKARWAGQDVDGPLVFAINLFTGLIVFNLFSECVSRAPTLVLANPSYVKKVVFPLAILVPVALANAVFHAACSLVILGLFELASLKTIPLTAILLPLAWMPLLLGTMAISWILASLGVFLRDIGQLIGVLLSMLMYLSPVFFPITALPAKWRPILNLNPLALVIEQTRAVLVDGKLPSALYVIAGSILGVLACEAAFRMFEKSRRAFPDVI